MEVIRRALPPASRELRSAAIVERIVALEPWLEASVVASFGAIRGEAELGALRRHAAQEGKIYALPRIDPGTRELSMHRVPPGMTLEPGVFGVPEPPADAERVPLEAICLILVPALAIDLRGHRIGYGKGYYDRILERSPQARTCGVVFDFQLMAEIPELPHDRPVERIVTDAQSLRVGSLADGGGQG